MTAKQITDRLSILSKDLLFPSESDFPLEPFTWESATITPEIILTRSQKPADTAIESINLEDFFAPVMTDEDWFDDEDRAIAQRFRDLKTAIATLENCLTKSAFKALCHNFRESTMILTRFQEVIMIVETIYARTIEE